MNWSETQRDIWAGRAKDYDKIQWTTDDGLLREFLSHCCFPSQSLVLDVGGGTGIIAQALAGHVRWIECIDTSTTMLEQCKKNTDLQNLTFKEMDVQNLEYSPRTFDFATARMVFHHVEYISQGLGEVFRVLKPGGSLVLMEGVPPDWRCRERYDQIFALKEKRHTFSEAELLNALDRAGFKEIALYPYWMRKVSLAGWLAHSGLEFHVQSQIADLHRFADNYFHRAYNLIDAGEDIFMDWKFVTVVGRKL